MSLSDYAKVEVYDVKGNKCVNKCDEDKFEYYNI